MIGSIEKTFLEYVSYYNLYTDYEKKARDKKDDPVPEILDSRGECSSVFAIFTSAIRNIFYPPADNNIKNKIGTMSQQEITTYNTIHQEIVPKIRALSLTVCDPDQTIKLMEEVIGYMQFPILDLQERMGYQDEIDILLPRDMTNPVMRFEDKYGRLGFAICAKSSTNGKKFVQAFYQRQTESPDWTSSPQGRIIPMTSTYLILNGYLNIKALEKLKSLFKNELMGWTLCLGVES